MKRQLHDLRAVNKRMGGVMRVPPIMNLDAWEKAAALQQDALIAASHEDRADHSKEKAVVIGADPANVTHRYRVAR